MSCHETKDGLQENVSRKQEKEITGDPCGFVLDLCRAAPSAFGFLLNPQTWGLLGRVKEISFYGYRKTLLSLSTRTLEGNLGVPITGHVGFDFGAVLAGRSGFLRQAAAAHCHA